MPHLGILGAGQLGRMLALAGYPLGLQFRFFDTSATATAGQVAELRVGSFKDEAALADFATGLDLVTQRLPVFPPARLLATAQDRLEEKRRFAQLGIPTPDFRPVESLANLEAAVAELKLPAVLKTRRFGYDGKGQAVLREPADLSPAFARLGGVPLILEAFVPFDREVSLLFVQGRDGSQAAYPLVENVHRLGILRSSRAPAPGTTPQLQALAEDYGQRLARELGCVGVLAIEFFQVGDGLLANEMAPRVHNSGHWTIEGAETSQFANHLRAVLGWPLGTTAARGEVLMLNCIGQLPEPTQLLAERGVYLHDYAKEALPGRKLGHVTIVADSEAELRERAAAVTPWVVPREVPTSAD